MARKKKKPPFAGQIHHQKTEGYDFRFEQVGKTWKTTNGLIARPVYAYKLKTRTKLCSIDRVWIDQGFCIYAEIEYFSKHGLAPRGHSIFVAMTLAMEARARQNFHRAIHAFSFRNELFPPDRGRYFCQKPFDMVIRPGHSHKRAQVRFFDLENSCIRALDGKVIAQ